MTWSMHNSCRFFRELFFCITKSCSVGLIHKQLLIPLLFT